MVAPWREVRRWLIETPAIAMITGDRDQVLDDETA
jgi:hypothetical protein